MSAPTFEINTLAPIAILTASLLGSTHCLAMCGGLTTLFAKSRAEAFYYHLGRLITYSALGALSGAFGKMLLRGTVFQFLPWLTTVILSGTLAYLGVMKIKGKSFHLKLPSAFQSSYQKVFRILPQNAFTVGALSGFLPCGWLYTFVLAAATTQSAAGGATAMVFFWMGTVPILSSASILFTKLLKPLQKQAPKTSGVLLILAAFFTIAMRAAPLFHPAPTPAIDASCPFHKNKH